MVRVIIKGGVWKNTEDEILKAAIMKYGKNQWSRIASLLHRKSAKQCKARWFEWLDPGIKKTEWSREEDEKLLHLAKLMPTQWRTIAPIVGRTSAQCLERYEHLLDEAQRKAEGLDEEATEARKLKPGEIDPTPETKPARPDPIDMDDDELEMLSEARARLANTQGKKAKRKARERQLSDARRLASLQKRREMRAAGLAFARKFKPKRNQIDYSEEIPFEKHVPAGFHDPSEDKYVVEDANQRAIDDHQKPRGREIEMEMRREDREKLKKRKEQGEADAVFNIKEKKRSKLVLPEPQISDRELEQIVKIGHASDSVRQYIDETATSGLLTDYTESARANAVAARTMRTPMPKDTIQMEIENIMALQNTESVLKGGLNTPLHETELGKGVLPTPKVLATPNTVLHAIAATPGTQSQMPGATPGFATPAGSVSATPFRDQMRINEEIGGSALEQKSNLKRALASLPTPKNDFEIVGPDDDDVEGVVDDDKEQEDDGWVEDASERAEKQAKKNAEIRIRNLKMRSQVIQRSLPRPSKVNELATRPTNASGDLPKADDMIKVEMSKLLAWDVDNKQPDIIYSREDLDAASELIRSEADAGPELNEMMWKVVEQCTSEMILSKDKFTRIAILPREEQMKALNDEFQMYRGWMNQRAKKAAKVEKKLRVKLGGYQAIHDKLCKKYQEVANEIEMANIEKKLLSEEYSVRLGEHELKAINKRVGRLQQEVETQESREKELQKTYSKLSNKKWKLSQIKIHDAASTTSAPVTY
uniref:Cell division cycle 5-like protein n=1 Tax=Caenorhabditis tropicalis TaxID=1561998 RepID=A0A1I7UXV1_9PELO